MKYVKMLGLAAVAAMAFMAFAGAGSASAATSTLCSTATNPCTSAYPIGTVLDFSLEPEKSAELVTTDKKTVLDKCSGSTVKGKLERDSRTTPTAQLAGGKLTELTWTGCTFPTKTLTPIEGGLEVEGLAGGNGTIKSFGEIRVTIQTVLFGSCVYGVTAGTHLGTLTEGKPATIDAEAVAKKLSGSEAACPETSLWTGKYIQTEPKETTMYVSNP